MGHAVAQRSFPSRFAVYCRERFPLVRHGAVIAAFVFATIGCMAALADDRSIVSPRAFAHGFALAFLCFLELRILDEFKDAEIDARYRPERPVPRGLVTLRELAGVAALAGLVQLVVAALAGPPALAWLVATFAWMALMTREFFVGVWLRSHPIVYLATHTVVVPLIALVVAACAGPQPDAVLLAPFLLFAYASSTVFEFGRKIRAPADERPGVETYTALWGIRGGVLAWGAALIVSAALAVIVASRLHAALPIAAVAALAVVAAGVVASRFFAAPAPGQGNRFAIFSGAWLVGIYVLLGALALVTAR